MDYKDWQKELKEHNKKYRQECLDELKAGGFDTAGLTPSQAMKILEPSHAPENFYCDGEVPHSIALLNWRNALRSEGLTPLQIHKAEKYIFG